MLYDCLLYLKQSSLLLTDSLKLKNSAAFKYPGFFFKKKTKSIKFVNYKRGVCIFDALLVI